MVFQGARFILPVLLRPLTQMIEGIKLLRAMGSKEGGEESGYRALPRERVHTARSNILLVSSVARTKAQYHVFSNHAIEPYIAGTAI